MRLPTVSGPAMRGAENRRELGSAGALRGPGVAPAQGCVCYPDSTNSYCIYDMFNDRCPGNELGHCARTFNPRTGQYQCQCACY